jgi:hypothetical protein
LDVFIIKADATQLPHSPALGRLDRPIVLETVSIRKALDQLLIPGRAAVALACVRLHGRTARRSTSET